MKKLILLLVLAAMSNVAIATEGWAQVANDGNSTLYMPTSPDQVTEEGHMVTLWDLTDFNVAQPLDDLKFLSIKTQHVYDCLEVTTRILAVITYSKHMGKGSIVASTDVWIAIDPDTRGALKFEIACGTFK